VLARLFPGKPALAQFAWDTDQKRTSREVLEDAGYAKNAGLAIDIDQVAELTGYRLEKAPETPSFPGGPGAPQPPFVVRNSKASLQTALNALQIALNNSDAQGDLPAENALVEALRGLFEKSLAEAAAEAVGGEGEDEGEDGGEITQEQAEKPYEEMMAK
ncbi:MAG: hypothetical protein J6T51_04535, partial [Kiritimatiellae bacterium]|nr:hypothetical protein [Kiritimatiellia bacterium]